MLSCSPWLPHTIAHVQHKDHFLAPNGTRIFPLDGEHASLTTVAAFVGRIVLSTHDRFIRNGPLAALESPYDNEVDLATVEREESLLASPLVSATYNLCQNIECNCPAFRMIRRHCLHVIWVLYQLYGVADDSPLLHTLNPTLR